MRPNFRALLGFVGICALIGAAATPRLGLTIAITSGVIVELLTTFGVKT